MVLTDDEIRAACLEGLISIDPFADSQIEPASYDLRVGPKAAASSTKKITNLEEAGFLLVSPGDFVIVSTYESMRLDASHVGRFGLTSKHARSGLIATVGPQIDPGYHGRLTIGLTNLSTKPVTLSYKDTFLTVEFHRLETPSSKPYSGKYQDRFELAPDDIEAVMEREYMSQTEMMQTLQTLVSTVDALRQVVNIRFPIYIALILGVYAAIQFFGGLTMPSP